MGKVEKIEVRYKEEGQDFPLDVNLDDEIIRAIEGIGFHMWASGSGFGERDLSFRREEKS